MRRIALAAALALLLGGLAPVPALASGPGVPAAVSTMASGVRTASSPAFPASATPAAGGTTPQLAAAAGTTPLLAAAAQLPRASARVPATPRVQYQVTRAYDLRATASSSARKLTRVPVGAYLVGRSVRGSWVQASRDGKVGWFPGSHARKLPQPRYEALRATVLRATAGKGPAVVRVARGKQVIATGRLAGSYLQLYSAGKTGWAKRSDVRRTVTAKFQTRHATILYASATSTRKLATIPADYTVASRGTMRSKGRVHVQYGSTAGWVQESLVSRVALATATGRLSWRQSAAKNISRWCRSVPVTAGADLGNFATASGWSGNFTERITLDTENAVGARLDPNHPQAVAIQYHECAHILQYRAFAYDFPAMDRRMNAVYGNGNGTEHMADCMAVAMGARLSGTERNGWTWTAGYGGKCTADHLAAARKVIAGKRV